MSKEIFELFDDINVIALLGGEPLLNPELDRYCEMLRTLYPYSDIKIITNGLWVNKMSEKLIECIETNQIKIHISYYPPLMFLIDDMVEFMRRHNIKYHFGEPVTQFNCKMTIENPTDPNTSFEKCRDRCCTTLRDGYLYLATYL